LRIHYKRALWNLTRRQGKNAMLGRVCLIWWFTISLLWFSLCRQFCLASMYLHPSAWSNVIKFSLVVETLESSLFMTHWVEIWIMKLESMNLWHNGDGIICREWRINHKGISMIQCKKTKCAPNRRDLEQQP